MVEGDGSKRAHIDRGYDVGGIESAAQAHLTDNDAAFASGKMLEGDGGHQLEFGGMGIHGLGSLAYTERHRNKVVVADLKAIDANALLKMIDIRAGEQTYPITRLLQDAGHECAG